MNKLQKERQTQKELESITIYDGIIKCYIKMIDEILHLKRNDSNNAKQYNAMLLEYVEGK